MIISVIMPLYNKKPYVQRAIDSVLAQTHKDYELIVVDDGSTDGGGDVVRQYTDPRIRLIAQENAGVSAARNRGIAEAKGEWIAFLDADDEWRPTFLERMMDAGRRFDAAVAVFGDFLCADPANRQAVAIGEERDRPPYMVENYFQFFLNHGVGMCSSCLAVRRDAIREVGGFPEGRKIGEDMDTWFRVACFGKVAFVPEVLATYHTGFGACAVHGQNLDLWDTYEAWLKAGRIPAELVASCTRLAIRFRLDAVMQALRKGNRSEARRLFGVLRGTHKCSPMGMACWLGCYFPLLPRTMQWGIVRFAQKYFSGVRSRKWEAVGSEVELQ